MQASSEKRGILPVFCQFVRYPKSVYGPGFQMKYIFLKLVVVADLWLPEKTMWCEFHLNSAREEFFLRGPIRGAPNGSNGSATLG